MEIPVVISVQDIVKELEFVGIEHLDSEVWFLRFQDPLTEDGGDPIVLAQITEDQLIAMYLKVHEIAKSSFHGCGRLGEIFEDLEICDHNHPVE